MTRMGWRLSRPAGAGALAVLLGLGLLASPGRATVEFGAFQLSGNFETQNILRTPDANDFEFIQQRNTVRLRVDWDWLQGGKFLERFDIPFIESSRFYLLYRGVYDGFYDLAPGGNQTGQSRFDDLIGGPVEGNRIGSCANPVNGACRAGSILRRGAYSRFTDDTRDSLKFENRLREIYVDFTFRDFPLTVRAGRQQVIWGEADQFRLMDIWNPLDVTWRFPIGDTFDNFRVPLWMIKGIYDLGQIGPLTNTFAEVVYNPFDFQPGQKVDWLPRPWSLPFPNPLRSGQVQAASVIPGTPPSLLVSPVFDLQGTSFKHGDFQRSPEHASEVGARFHAVLPFGLESTINYIYGRGKWVGNSPAFGVRIEEASSNITQQIGTFRSLDGGPSLPVAPAAVRARVVHPYVHVFGITGNYFEADYTSAVLRMESAYALGEPFATTAEDKLIPVTNGFGRKLPVGFEKRDVWAGMLGFDRPTWIRFLNNKATWFMSYQFFWTNIPGHGVKKLRGFSAANRDPFFTPGASGPLGSLNSSQGVGVWDSGQFTGQIERTQNGDLSPEDNYLPWEFLMTFTMTSFYRGGSVAPLLTVLYDPVNDWIVPLLQLEILYTNSFIITLQERVFVPMNPPTNDPWFVGRFGRRHETAVRFTYQF